MIGPLARGILAGIAILWIISMLGKCAGVT
jgi:hypothetical protein